MPRLRLLVPWDADSVAPAVPYAETDDNGRVLPVRLRESRLCRLIEQGHKVVATQDRLTLAILAYFVRLSLYEGLVVEVWEGRPGGSWDATTLGPDGYAFPLFVNTPAHQSLLDSAARYQNAMRPIGSPEPEKPSLEGKTWEELIRGPV